MEVLFVSHKYPPSTGGMEKQSFELIRGMQSRTVVHKIVYTGEETYIQFFRQLNNRILKMVHIHPEIGLIHFNDGLIAALSLSHSGYQHVKRVVTVHGLDVVFPWSVYQRFIINKFRKFDHIIAVSRATAEAIIKRGIPKEKVSVIVNGIDHTLAADYPQSAVHNVLQKYGIPEDKRILITLGRPVKRKGFSWFIREVLPQLPSNVFLVMVGPFEENVQAKEKWLSILPNKLRHLYMLFMGYPSDQAELRNVLNHTQNQQRLKHVGKIPLEDLKIMLNYAHAFLMPNIRVEGDMEGFGLVCLEASMCGTLVFASDIEGITDAIHHQKNGIQVAHQDAEAWKNEILESLKDIDFHKDRRKNYRAFTLENFSWEKMVDSYLQLFEKITRT
ncbi:glycosyltransferase family 4 protein [Sphingobacterium sp. LRF_L2]|uniref:glycosyltransferase family 4 protein n=1 Tax=Sphingobacterium sp. LRF_L2 TaxID=3369421 RepID=UPI003F5EF272